MVKWPFRRNQTEQEPQELPLEQQEPMSNLPEEVQEYYESGSRGRKGVAWLLGLATLCVTLILAMGLFFGGRWVFRKIAGNDKPNTTQQIGQSDDEKKAEDDKKQDQNTSSTNTQSTPNSSPAPSGSTPSPNNNQGTSTPSAPSPAPSATGQNPSTSQATPGKTPNTGPGNVVAVFMLTSLAGTTAYQVVARRQNRI